MGCGGWLAESVGRWRPEAQGEFLQFTVGSYPRQNALQQGVAPTMEQICCTVGSKPTQNHLCGRLLPTVNCRNSRRRICWGKRLPGKENAIYREFFSRAVCTKCNQVFHYHWNQMGLCSPWRAVHSHCRSPRGPLKACSTQF